ncbi:MAG: CHAT domain-containing protein [Caldilineaceae bacterium]
MERKAWPEACKAYAYGMMLIDRLYYRQVLAKFKFSWLRQANDLVENAAYALAKIGRLADAVLTLEQGRTRTLDEALSRQEVVAKAVSTVDLDAYKAVSQRIVDLEAELRLTDQPGGRDKVFITAELRQTHDLLQAIVARVHNNVPNLMPQELSLSEITALADTLYQPLVYLITTSQGSLALIVLLSRQAATAAVTAVWLDDFDRSDLANILYDHENTHRYLHGTVFGHLALLRSVLDSIWTTLDQKLMAKLISHLHLLDGRRAMLIPTGTLALLPLHAVALDAMTFQYIPSARALYTVLNDKDHISRPLTFLGIGNPLNRRQQSLAFARIEVEKVATLFDEAKLHYLIYCEEEATRQHLVTYLPGTTHLHFSCHGRFDVYDPLRSALYLAGDDTLTLHNLLDGSLDVSAVRLAVLSACQTGITDFQSVPDEAIGFPAGFLQAGIPGVVSTLWSVDELSTALLMNEFYRQHLKAEREPADALRQAQLWLREATAEEMKLAGYYEQLYIDAGRRDREAFQWMNYYRANPTVKPFAHPYYWAGFVFSGV